MPWDRITIGHVPLDCVTQREALDAIDALIRADRGGFVVTPNIDHLVMAERDTRLRDVYRTANLSLIDGQPVAWMARLLGASRATRVSGSDLLEPLMAEAAAAGRRVFLFGATPEVSAEAARRLVERFPRLQIAGRDCSTWSPLDPTAAHESPVVRAIRASGADLVVLALGCPKQELWMARHATALAPAVLIGLGASLDFVAGAVRRAPAWMSNAGLEWLFRLVQEPRRLAHRYLVRDVQVLPIVAREWYRRVVATPRPLETPTPVAHEERP